MTAPANIAAPARAAIVTTLRGAAPVLDSFIRYHLALGFAHLYLFFDDPADPALAIARAQDPARVSAFVRGDLLDAQWRTCVQFAYFEPHLAQEVMARQCLNVEVAVQAALAARCDWLLHIDADELFHCPGQDAPGHFGGLSAQGIERAVYPNLEALNEAIDVGDWFREVTLFKVNRNTLPGGRLTPAQAALAARYPQFTDNFFLFYSNGKSAARLRPGRVPDGVHRFRGKLYPRPGQPVAKQPADIERVSGDCRILHYACCGFSNFVEKYRILGHFADRWFGSVDIRASIGGFHTGARDVVSSGEPDRALAYYRRYAMLDDREAVRTLIEAGLLSRVDGPARWLNRELERLP